MGLVNDLRSVLDDCRGIMGELGFREHSVTLIRTLWSGGRTGAGVRAEEAHPLYVGNAQSPKVRFPNQRDIASGMVSLGTITIGPLTPLFTRPDGTESGILRDLLALSEAEWTDTVHLFVQGPQHPNGAKYRCKNLNCDKPLRIMITAVIVSGK